MRGSWQYYSGRSASNGGEVDYRAEEASPRGMTEAEIRAEAAADKSTYRRPKRVLGEDRQMVLKLTRSGERE